MNATMASYYRRSKLLRILWLQAPAFDVWSPDLFCGWPGGLELVTRLSSRSDTFFWQFPLWSENYSFLVLLAHTAH